MLSQDVDKVIKTPLKVFNTISPIQMYQRKTVEHLPLGYCFIQKLQQQSLLCGSSRNRVSWGGTG